MAYFCGTFGDGKPVSPRVFAVTICALACSSCVHQVQTASSSTTVPAVPAVHEMMMRQARNAAEAGDGDLELRRLRQFLAANPKNPDARVLLARYYESRGLPDLSLEHYRLAAEEFPESSAITIALAKTLREMGNPAEGVRVLQAYSARQPHAGWEALSLQGILEDEQTHYAAAESAHRAAVAAAPERSDLHNNLGYNLLTQGHADAAIEEFRRAIELDPKSEIAHNNLASALASQPGPASKEAIAEWSRSAGEAEAHSNMAAVLISQGRYAEARGELAAALQLQPGLGAALANLRLLAEKDGQPATLPLRASNSRKRTLWGKIFGKREEPKPAAAQTDVSSNGGPADSVAATAANKK